MAPLEEPLSVRRGLLLAIFGVRTSVYFWVALSCVTSIIVVEGFSVIPLKHSAIFLPFSPLHNNKQYYCSSYVTHHRRHHHLNFFPWNYNHFSPSTAKSTVLLYEHLETVGNCMMELACEIRVDNNTDTADPNLKQQQQQQQQRCFQLAGEALLVANTYWKLDWTETTIAFANAAEAFQQIADHTLSSSSSSSSFSTLYQTIADEFYDASTISGCISIGPMSSIPNLQTIQECLQELSELPPFDDVATDDYDSTLSSTKTSTQSLLLKASNAISKLIEEKEME